MGWILFDADCALCAGSAKRAARFLARHGFGLIPLQTPGAAEHAGVTLAELLTRVHLVDRQGRRFAGADAVVEVARHVGWARPLALVAGSPLVLPALRRIYDWIAVNRYCFGGRCPAPRRRRALDWLPLLVLPLVGLVLRDRMADWVFMWVMAFSLFAGCKWITYRRAVTSGAVISMGRTLGYLFGWVGMKAEVFAGTPIRERDERRESVLKRTTSRSTTCVTRPDRSIPVRLEWFCALGRTLLGAVLVWFVARMIVPFAPLGAGWVAMLGLILLLHFGAFQLLALTWQRFGVAVEPLMRAPLLAASLGDFWGVRWNTGFHVVAHEFLFRPLSGFFGRLRQRRTVGPILAKALPVLGVFLVSGWIHEMVITLPAHGGYGLPTAYFLLQGLGLVLERSAAGRRFGLGAGLRGRLFTMVVAAGPACWLFPPVFVHSIILPMLEAIGAL